MGCFGTLLLAAAASWISYEIGKEAGRREAVGAYRRA
jgi:hypothetical protein